LKLYLLRHGQAGARKSDLEKDASRALTPGGRQDISILADTLKALGLSFDTIASSPLKRTEDTAKIVAERLGLSKRLEKWKELEPTSDTSLLLMKLSGLRTGSAILIVGHEPQLSTVVGEITSGRPTRLALKKGGIAKINVDEFRPRISGELQWLLTPKIVKKVAG
jgi:phosphohistidine phosphatase